MRDDSTNSTSTHAPAAERGRTAPAAQETAQRSPAPHDDAPRTCHFCGLVETDDTNIHECVRCGRHRLLTVADAALAQRDALARIVGVPVAEVELAAPLRAADGGRDGAA